MSEQLRAPVVAELLADLPASEPHKIRMPDRPTVEWPRMTPAALRNAA